MDSNEITKIALVIDQIIKDMKEVLIWVDDVQKDLKHTEISNWKSFLITGQFGNLYLGDYGQSSDCRTNDDNDIILSNYMLNS